MNFNHSELIFLGIIAGSANVLGGLLLMPTNLYMRLKPALKYLLALGAGFMLTVNFIEIFPKVFAMWAQKTEYEYETRFFYPMVLILAGYLLTQFFEHTIAPHFHLGEEVKGEHLISSSAAYTAVGGLMIHTFFDGVSIAAASQIDYKSGILVFFAVFLHKFPEGFTIASLVLAAGKSFRAVLTATAIVGLTTFAGVMIYTAIGSSFGVTAAYALPLASGVTLYVAASDLIPEANHHGGKRPLVSIFVFAGAALFFLLHFIFHTLSEH